MFDYQAGEKFKLTLIMVGFAGLMAGMFFTMLLMPTSEPQHKTRQRPAWADHPDVTGGRGPRAAQFAVQAAANDANSQPAAQQTPAVAMADPHLALTLVETFLPLAWDLSAGSAKQNQEKAMICMTPECAQAYQQNIWTADLAKQIEESGLQTSFQAKKIAAGQVQSDGSVVIFVEGEQMLNVPGGAQRSRPVKLEYLVKQTQVGMRIAGISESGSTTI